MGAGDPYSKRFLIAKAGGVFLAAIDSMGKLGTERRRCMARRGGSKVPGAPARTWPGVFPLARIGKFFPSLTIFLFRFLSRFRLNIPVLVTVAPVSCCCSLSLAVTGIP